MLRDLEGRAGAPRLLADRQSCINGRWMLGFANELLASHVLDPNRVIEQADLRPFVLIVNFEPSSLASGLKLLGIVPTRQREDSLPTNPSLCTL